MQTNAEKNIKLGSGEYTYIWRDNWARIPATPSGRENGRTHGVAVSREGFVIVFNQADPAVLFFDPEGKLAKSWGAEFPGAHGLTIVEEGGEEYLWLTDHDTKEVVKTTLDGRRVLNLERPDHPVYQSAEYAPTWVAVNEERAGGNGDIWVADGYGSFVVHRYDKNGRYLMSIDGSEGQSKKFKCPHALWFDTRNPGRELYIADRANQQVQVYDQDGGYIRAFGSDYLTSPCNFRAWNDVLLVPELWGRVTLLGADDKPLVHLGSNREAMDIKGWPDLSEQQLTPGLFNSPHDMASDSAGNLYVVEWIIGGRITKLEKI